MRFVACISSLVCLQIGLTNALEVRVPRTRTAAPLSTVTVNSTTTSATASLPPATTTTGTDSVSELRAFTSTENSIIQPLGVADQTQQNSSSTESSSSSSTTNPAFDETTTVVVEVTKRDTVTEVPLTTSARFKTTLDTMSFNVNDFNSDLKCGIRPMHHKSRNRIKRIVGGSSATEGEWPWQVIVKEVKYLGTIADYKCGGVLISERHVLTAAHCKPRAFLSTLVVILGQHRLHEKNLQTIPVTRMIVHKHFNEADFDNDLAVLELKYPVDFSSKIVPICLPDLDEEFVGRSGYVTGWGKLAHKGGLPKVLQNVKLPIIARENCQQMFLKSGHVKKIHDYFLCAGYEGGQLDACEGDSGGPLSVQRPNGQWVLAGTVSHGIRCAEPNLPGVYMNISYYRSWIERMMTLHRTLRSPQEPEQRWFRPLWSVFDFYKKRKASLVYISK